MPRELLGQGEKITAYQTTLVQGSSDEPWLVWWSTDAGVFPIEQHRTKKAALASAKYWTQQENDRHKAWNAKSSKKLPRHLFDDFYVKRYDR